MKLEELEVLEVIEELEVLEILEILDKTRNTRNSRKIMPEKKSSGGFLFRRTLSSFVSMKKGGYLLSRIALQYHRRKRA